MDAKPKTLLIFSILLILPALMIARIVPNELDSLLDPEKGSGGNNVQQASSSSGVDDGNNESTEKNLIKELTSGNQDNYTNARVEAHLDNPNYFEGDLIVSEEEILEAYGPIMGTTSSHVSLYFDSQITFVLRAFKSKCICRYIATLKRMIIYVQ